MSSSHPSLPRLETPRPLLQKQQETDAEAHCPDPTPWWSFCPFQNFHPCPGWWLRMPLFLALLMTLALPLNQAQAQRGLPPSPEFGLGLSLETPEQVETLDLAQADWVSFPLVLGAADDPQSPFGQAISRAQALGLAVCVSLRANGQSPDPQAALQQVNRLLEQYPSLQVIELFPSANTRQGWGAAPAPLSYASLFLTVQSGLTRPVVLAAGGLETSPQPDEMQAEDFLRGLYAAGLRPALLSLHLNDLPENPGPQTLTRLEALRALMLENAQPEGMVWITQLTPPEAILSAPPQTQASWRAVTLEMLRAQLYLGAAFEMPAPSVSPWQRCWQWLQEWLGGRQ